MNTARIARERLDYIVPWDRICVGDLRAWRPVYSTGHSMDHPNCRCVVIPTKEPQQ